MSKFNLRFVTVKGVRYLHVEDVATFLRHLGGGEDTDVRTRLDEAASNLVAASTQPSQESHTRIAELEAEREATRRRGRVDMMKTGSEMATLLAKLAEGESFLAYAHDDGTEVRVIPRRSTSNNRRWYSIFACRFGRPLLKKQVAYQPGAAAKKARALVTSVARVGAE